MINGFSYSQNGMLFDELMKKGEINMQSNQIPTTENNGVFVPTAPITHEAPCIYTTNNSVDMQLLGQIINCFMLPDYKWARVNSGSEYLNYKLGLVSHVLTQIIPIFVRHDNFIYRFNGKIYIKVINSEECYPMIREICENVARVIPGLECSFNNVIKVFNEITQKAMFVNYPDNIHNLIVFNNGILNLLTMELEPFRAGTFITNMVNVDWTFNYECPNFERLLNVYTQGDNVLKERLLEALGVCLTNDIVKKIICFLGVSHSGKSFLVCFLLSLINDEAIYVLQPNDFERQFATSMIHEKSIIACMDMEASPLNTKATATLKSISGHDKINFELKHANGGHTFVSRAHVILCSNYSISTIKEDAAFEMRKLIVPFDHRLNEEAVPPDILMQTLAVEKSAIAALLIQAYLRLKNRNYDFSGGTAYDSYVPMNGLAMSRDASFQAFINQMCRFTNSDEDFVFTSDLYAVYQIFAEQMGGFVFSGYNAFAKYANSFFGDSKHDRKYRNGNPNAESCYKGVVLNNS